MAATRTATSTLRVVLVLCVVAAGVLAVLVLRPAPEGGSPGDPLGDQEADGDAPGGLEPDEAPTPPSSSAPEPSPSPAATADAALRGLHVVLDPGHNAGNLEAPSQITELVDDGRGGVKACNTVGTATSSGYPEHAFTWDVTQRARAVLQEQGAEVTLTRQADGVGPCVNERGRSVGAADGDVLVSIHANGSEDPTVQGFFAMVSEPPLNEAQGVPSRALAQDLLDALAGAGFTPSTLYLEPIVGRADLATLNHAEAPAVMLELAEMRNPTEAALVESSPGRQRYAEAVARGITDWATDRG